MATYFVSFATGNDTNAGTLVGAPWKTITKVNSFAFVPGDIVQFNRGEVWNGIGLNINRSGAVGNPITFTAYGTGANPIITGLSTAGAWIASTLNRWNTVLGGLANCNVVFLDGVFQAVSKLPKGNQGYYNIDSSSGADPTWTINSTTGGVHGLPLFSTAQNVVGGELCYRPQHWVLWRAIVNTQTGTSVNFTTFPSTGGGASYSPTFRGAGYGFFLQNHPNCCSLVGEWSYDGGGRYSPAHTLTMNFGAGGPTGRVVQIATVDVLVQVNTSHDLTFTGIDFKGANSYLFNGLNAVNITVNACNVTGAGLHGFFGNGNSTGWKITNNNISFVNSIGLQPASGATGWTITGNIIDRIGSIAGMGGSGESAQYTGIKTRSGSTIVNNRVTNVGYLPIFFDGPNSLVQNNFINTYGFVKDDAGGIYCDGVFGSGLTGSIVDHNIVINGQGAPIGTSDSDMRTHGIYLDDAASNVEVRFNSVGMVGEAGIFLHVASNINIHDNTFYDCGFASLLIRNVDDTGGGHTTSNINWHNNIAFARTAGEFSMQIPSGTPSTWFATTTDNNHYCRPITSDGAIFNTGSGNIALPAWRTLLTSPRDINSLGSPVFTANLSDIRFDYNDTNSPKVVSLGATYVDVFNTSYPGTITLQPWTSAVLIRTGAAPTIRKKRAAQIIG